MRVTSRIVLRSFLLPVVLVAATLGWASPSESQVEPSAPTSDGSYRGYQAVRLLNDGTQELVDELNADRFFVPASVLKTITVATALHHLGADYRWHTRITRRGALAGSVLDGDLLIEPGADPTWGNALTADTGIDPIAALASQVRAGGLIRVTGDLIVDKSGFPGRPHPLDRAYDELPYRLGTPPAALSIDEATITVRVAPGPRVDTRAIVQAPDGVEVVNHAITVGRDRHGAGTLDFVPLWGTDTLLLRGEYPISEAPFIVSASDPSPDLRVARRLREALSEAGVTVEGIVRLESRVGVAAELNPAVAEFQSRPLGDLLEEILTESHNWYADMLTLTLALEVAGTGRFSDGVKVISDFVTGLVPDDAQTPRSLWIQDGSGLASSNLVTPGTVVRVLAYAIAQPWGRTLIGAMAGPGEGTLAAWPSMPPVAAKTGTLRHTVGLAGVLDPDLGAPVVFCYFVNHHPEQPQAARREIAAAVARWRSEDTAR
jgi:D-alanyl-D-alanine carboxypeptidase/D-alanyl-D-alanine-endopeptidase (penicillin-binding protein 4)